MRFGLEVSTRLKILQQSNWIISPGKDENKNSWNYHKKDVSTSANQNPSDQKQQDTVPSATHPKN